MHGCELYVLFLSLGVQSDFHFIFMDSFSQQSLELTVKWVYLLISAKD